MIKLTNYSINNVLLTNKVLSIYINKFWNDVYSQIKGENHLWIMCKVHYSEIELGYRTLGHLRRVNFADKELFLSYLSDRLNILNDSYTTLAISQISFSYIINEGLASEQDRLLLQNLNDKGRTIHRFNNYNLPISMNPLDYGTLILNNQIVVDGESINRFVVKNGRRHYQIDSTLDGLVNKVTILGASDFKWTDTALIEGFHREIGKSTIYFLDGEIVLRKQLIPSKPFRKLSSDKNLMSKLVKENIK